MEFFCTFCLLPKLILAAAGSQLSPVVIQVVDGQEQSSMVLAPQQGQQMLPARDPRAAVQEEFEIAMKSGRVEALDLFIKRHPDSPLAQVATREFYRLSQKQPSLP